MAKESIDHQLSGLPEDVHEYVIYSELPKSLGAQPLLLREWRDYRMLTQRDLAARSGLALTTVNEIETGKRTPRSSTLLRLATALDTEDFQLYNHPRDDIAVIPRFAREIEHLWDLSNQIGGAMSPATLARDYLRWVRWTESEEDQGNRHIERADRYGLWTMVAGVLPFLAEFWTAINNDLYLSAPTDADRRLHDMILKNWSREFHQAGLVVDRRDMGPANDD